MKRDQYYDMTRVGLLRRAGAAVLIVFVGGSLGGYALLKRFRPYYNPSQALPTPTLRLSARTIHTRLDWKEPLSPARANAHLVLQADDTATWCGIQFFGEPENVSMILFGFTLARDENDPLRERTGEHVVRFSRLVAPQWTGADEAVSDAMHRAYRSGQGEHAAAFPAYRSI